MDLIKVQSQELGHDNTETSLLIRRLNTTETISKILKSGEITATLGN
jgi:hypothetical protein